MAFVMSHLSVEIEMFRLPQKIKNVIIIIYNLIYLIVTYYTRYGFSLHGRFIHERMSKESTFCVRTMHAHTLIERAFMHRVE